MQSIQEYHPEESKKKDKRTIANGDIVSSSKDLEALNRNSSLHSSIRSDIRHVYD